MTSRILRIELRRSNARWMALLLLPAAFFFGEAGRGLTVLALDQRQALFEVFPLAMGVAAWHARREHRSRMDELLATTARPRWQRVLPGAAALGIGALAAYLVWTAVNVGVVAATWFTGDQLAPAAQITRDAIGMTGLIAFGAATLGANRAWIPPLSWTLLSWTVMALPWPPPATYRQVLTWMLQPADATPATVTALVLGATGVLAYAVLGPAHERP